MPAMADATEIYMHISHGHHVFVLHYTKIRS